MTERRGDGGFSVAAAPVGGRQPRRRPKRRLGVILVLVASLAIVAVGLLGPRLGERPYLDLAYLATPTPPATPTPTPTVRPNATPAPTPLPKLTAPDGVGPDGKLAYIAETLRFLDLKTGDSVGGPPFISGRDVILGDPAGSGWLCLCLEDVIDRTSGTQVARLDRIGPSGDTTGSTDLLTFPTARIGETDQEAFLFDVDRPTGSTRAVLASATRTDGGWSIAGRSIDLMRATATDETVLGPIELPEARSSSPEPSPELSPDQPEPGEPDLPPGYLDGPHVRVSPDGRSAIVWAVGQAIDRSGNARDLPVARGWRFAIEPDGNLEDVVGLPAISSLPPFCSWMGFASTERLAWVCPVFPAEGSTDQSIRYAVHILTVDGDEIATTEVAASPTGFLSTPVFDVANGVIYVWDPFGLVITRIDVDSLDAVAVTLDPGAESSVGEPPGGGDAPTVWVGADSAGRADYFTGIAGSKDGRRLFVVGFKAARDESLSTIGTLGVFVLDRSTLGVIARWAPAANDIAVMTLADGTVATIGQPGADLDGQPVPWGGSLTLRDPDDGRILARYGQLTFEGLAVPVVR